MFQKIRNFLSKRLFRLMPICLGSVLLFVCLFPIDALASSLATYNASWVLGGTVVSPGQSGTITLREMASVGFFNRQTKVNAGVTYYYDLIDLYVDYTVPLSFIIHSPDTLISSGSLDYNFSITPPYLISDPSGTISDIGWWTCRVVDVIGSGAVSASASVNRPSGATSATVSGKVQFNDRLISNGIEVGAFSVVVRCVYRWEYDSTQNYTDYYNFNQILSKYQSATVSFNNSSGTAFVYRSADDAGSAFSDDQKNEIDSAVAQQDSVQGNAMSHVDSYQFPDVSASDYSGGTSFLTSSVDLFTDYPAFVLLLGCALAFCIVRKVLY